MTHIERFLKAESILEFRYFSELIIPHTNVLPLGRLQMSNPLNLLNWPLQFVPLSNIGKGVTSKIS